MDGDGVDDHAETCRGAGPWARLVATAVQPVKGEMITSVTEGRHRTSNPTQRGSSIYQSSGTSLMCTPGMAQDGGYARGCHLGIGRFP